MKSDLSYGVLDCLKNTFFLKKRDMKKIKATIRGIITLVVLFIVVWYALVCFFKIYCRDTNMFDLNIYNSILFEIQTFFMLMLIEGCVYTICCNAFSMEMLKSYLTVTICSHIYIIPFRILPVLIAKGCAYRVSKCQTFILDFMYVLPKYLYLYKSILYTMRGPAIPKMPFVTAFIFITGGDLLFYESFEAKYICAPVIITMQYY
ncbi:hypothetical protein SLOPH_1106 [Spraguea lophii 42_110]|uniref:Uncharacterized protein n=1 Tax=Spraguea lophii (strain 42_110) TaxID=1358809 RepID=S7W6V4_SPRLO|nr:hypothetical protein SLOPH_1106 [Spraguea lophii 42_110]